jgi:hypothetical protein
MECEPKHKPAQTEWRIAIFQASNSPTPTPNNNKPIHLQTIVLQTQKTQDAPKTPPTSHQQPATSHRFP